MIYQLSNTRAAHIVVSRAALRHNLDRVRAYVPNAKVMAVIKANGYGHSMELVAEALSDADEYAVTCLDDVVRLREQGISKPLTMLSSRFNAEQLNSMSAQQVRPVIYDHEQLGVFDQLDSNSGLELWLKVDTGMGRLGFSIEDAHLALKRLSQCTGVKSVSAMTHLANADNPNNPSNLKQIDDFNKFSQGYEFKELSVLNSAGVIAFAEHAQEFVRPGVMLYGVSPQAASSAESLDLKPAMAFKSELISVKRLASGSPIGYGSTYTLDTDTRIGVIACGYADGYPRHAPSGTPVLVNGMYVPLIGRVSMDLITVDLGELPAKVGDEVILWGADNPIENIAEMSGTIAYELLCSITERVERIIT